MKVLRAGGTSVGPHTCPLLCSGSAECCTAVWLQYCCNSISLWWLSIVGIGALCVVSGLSGCRDCGRAGSPSGTPVRIPVRDPRQEPPSGSPSGCPSTPSTPSTPVNTPSTSVNPVNPVNPVTAPSRPASGPPSTDDNGVPTGSKRSTSLALILDMSLPNSCHTSVCMQMFRLTEHLPAC